MTFCKLALLSSVLALIISCSDQEEQIEVIDKIDATDFSNYVGFWFNVELGGMEVTADGQLIFYLSENGEKFSEIPLRYLIQASDSAFYTDITYCSENENLVNYAFQVIDSLTLKFNTSPESNNFSVYERVRPTILYYEQSPTSFFSYNFLRERQGELYSEVYVSNSNILNSSSCAIGDVIENRFLSIRMTSIYKVCLTNIYNSTFDLQIDDYQFDSNFKGYALHDSTNNSLTLWDVNSLEGFPQVVEEGIIYIQNNPMPDVFDISFYGWFLMSEGDTVKIEYGRFQSQYCSEG